MTHSEASADPTLYARSFADVYDRWYGDLDDPSHLVAACASRSQPGSLVVELGSGTGRLALPLSAAGYRVVALDASESMLRQSPAGPLNVGADMTAIPIAAGAADLVIVAYNTLFNLDSCSAQARCLSEIARCLCPGGLVGIETFIAPEPQLAQSADATFGLSERDHPDDPETQLVIITGPDPTNADVIIGSHIELGDVVTCRPWRVAYQSPEDLDGAAHGCGLALTERFANWNGDQFDPYGPRQVSWYRRS